MGNYLTLYVTLAKLSLCCFGGGYAILPLLEREMVEKKGWLKTEELNDIFAIAQVTPGIIAVNAATYVGAKRGGARGALCATLGLLTPPIILVTLIAAFFWPYLQTPIMRHALLGLQVCVCALIAHTVAKLFRIAVLDVWGLLLFLAALGLSFFASISPAILVISAGLIGLAISRMKGKGAKEP